MFDFKKPFYHFSIDDVISSLIEISDSTKNIDSHYFFNFLEKIHHKFDVNVDLYCFYQQLIHNKLKTLQDVTDKHKNYFSNNTWLRFGPHALEYDTPPYVQSPSEQKDLFDLIYHEIERFTGNLSTCKLLRLHFFTESYELSSYLKTKNVHSLFTTDKPAIAYRLNNDLKSKLGSEGMVNFNKINFIRSHFRIETLVNENFSDTEICKTIENCLTEHGFVSFLTHERELIRPEIQDTIEFVLNYLKDQNIRCI